MTCWGTPTTKFYRKQTYFDLFSLYRIVEILFAFRFGVIILTCFIMSCEKKLLSLQTQTLLSLLYLTIAPRARVGYEIANEAHSAVLAIIISYSTSASGIIVLSKTIKKHFYDLADLAFYEQPEDN